MAKCNVQNMSKSEQLFLETIKAKAKEDGIKLSSDEVREVFDNLYSSVDFDTEFHNIKATFCIGW